MPFVKIEIIAGKSAEYKKLLLQSVHDALVLSLGIPDDDRLQRIYELDRDDFEHRNMTDDSFTLIELTFFSGRSKEVKRDTIHEITSILGERLSIAPENIYIVINEPPLDNWGLRGQQASDMHMDYKK